ncbi:MAG: TnsA endonuclease N-terminal domain-containing protein [Anaeromicrobium sp.]|jgi:hypothetical protein|uniref:TnsA endonuclease N-terminal domain-containing protein n=1 Tax=Anaeromicrobium sp. TaxID=1929132 RepID=UPI0025EAE884|nr:TnsA endonuclease N-terminal domain-containing protein [Anaeromicrobium sp.]MCT4594727.1 TnsA endonuclease N-terminal domain-containing protein [Anaeromicrobium sp.]
MSRHGKSDICRLKEKRGLGRGINYIPWIKVHEVPSRGRKHRVLGVKHKRIYHFLSDLEYYFYLLQIFDSNVVEIREQFPLLSLETTKLIAEELNIRHPSVGGRDIVMTTDFLITVKKDNIYTGQSKVNSNNFKLKKYNTLMQFYSILISDKTFKEKKLQECYIS